MHSTTFVSAKNLYVMTLFLVVLAGVFQFWSVDILEPDHIYLLYFPVVVLAALFGGLYTGVFATLLSCAIIPIIIAIFVPIIIFDTSANWIAMAIFVFNGILISGFSEGMRRANMRQKIERQQMAFVLNATQQGYWNLNIDTNDIERSILYDRVFGYTHSATQ